MLGTDSLLRGYSFGFDVYVRNLPLIQQKWPHLQLSKKDLALFGDQTLPDIWRGSKTGMELDGERPENPGAGEKQGNFASRKSPAATHRCHQPSFHWKKQAMWAEMHMRKNMLVC